MGSPVVAGDDFLLATVTISLEALGGFVPLQAIGARTVVRMVYLSLIRFNRTVRHCERVPL